MSKATIALVALLTVAMGACSDDRSSSAATPATEATDLATAPETSVAPAPATAATSVTQPDATTVSSSPRTSLPPPTAAATGEVVPSTKPPVATTRSTAPKAPTTTAAAPTSVPSGTGSGAKLVDTDCTAAPTGTRYDLLHFSVEALASRYRLIAQYSGDTPQHDILVTFDLGGATYLVTGELFEQGSGVAQVSNPRTLDSSFLDPPQVVKPSLVDLTVRNDQMPAIAGTAFSVTVSLRVDGSPIETCG